MGICQRCRSQLKEFPMAKAGTIWATGQITVLDL